MLIESLIEYRKKKGHDITVVFDGWKTGGALENHSVIGGIRVIYSRLGEKADFVIRRIISSEKRGWIVVTSDRDIATHAWTSGAVPISSEDFMNAMEKRHIEKKVLYEGENEDEEYVKPSRKGSPRKLSKKEKAIKKVLSKL
jgi:predicted RNA-binding protein with PIN domain